MPDFETPLHDHGGRIESLSNQVEQLTAALRRQQQHLNDSPLGSILSPQSQTTGRGNYHRVWVNRAAAEADNEALPDGRTSGIVQSKQERIVTSTTTRYPYCTRRSLSTRVLPSLGILAIFRDEGQNMYEWLLHHHMEGVTQFVLLDQVTLSSAYEFPQHAGLGHGRGSG